MQILKVDIIGISEVKWNRFQENREQDFFTDDYRIITTKSNKGVTGVGAVMKRRIGKRVSYFEQHSDRIIFITIETKSKPTSIVQVYMPTPQSVDEEVENVFMRK